MFFRLFYSAFSMAVFIVLTALPFCLTGILYDAVALRITRPLALCLLPVFFIVFVVA